MKDIFCKLFSGLKYVLFIFSFGLVLFGLLTTFKRLEKPITDGIDVFIPFALVFITFLISFISGNKYVSKNLLFNFVSTMIFVSIIIVCTRSMFDQNMILFHRYGINFNSSFFSDNLSIIQIMLYMIGVANILLLIAGFVDKDKKFIKEEVKKEAKDKKHNLEENSEE